MKILNKTKFWAILCSVFVSTNLFAVNSIANHYLQKSINFDLNLGESEWKFAKLIPKRQDDLTKDKVLFVSEDTDLSKILSVNLDTASVLESLSVGFSNTDINQVYYTVLGSADKQIWNVLADKSDYINAGQQVKFIKKSDVTQVANTVGFVEKIVSTKLEIPLLPTKVRFIKVLLKRVLNTKNENTTPLDIHMTVYGAQKDKFSDSDYSSKNFNDSIWETVGIPHCYNDMDTYLNSNDVSIWHGTVWYRKKIMVDKRLQNKKLFLEFKGINTGAAVYINGKFKAGNTKVTQPGDVTHIGGFLPFMVDITDDLKYGEENQIAVKVSNSDGSFFKWPGFGVYDGFAMNWGGMVSPVILHVTNKVYIPENTYSPLQRWGTYFSTIEANDEIAKLKFQANVVNETKSKQKAVLINDIRTSNGKLVLHLRTEREIDANCVYLFEQEGDIPKPNLWYPNNSPFGKPNLYHLKTSVEIGGKLIYEKSSKLGVRTYSWDGDYCYVNGKKHLMVGFGHRNCYPALGSAVPEEIQWKDMKLIADAGGNTLRIGHVPATDATLDACDEYGIMVMQNSGDNEWALRDEPALTYKREYDRDMMIHNRNRASIAVWESNNGIAKAGDKYLPSFTQALANQWDSLQNRIVATRDKTQSDFPKDKRLMVGYSNLYKKIEGSPSINVEVYGAFWDGRRSINISRDDYSNEKQFVNWFVDDYVNNLKDRACGWLDWMLAETQGEGYTIYVNGKSKQKSLGSSAMDGNRIPKLKYHVFKNALWIDYKTKPGIALQSSWNLSGIQTVDAWSNCPKVELFLNDKSMGVRVPDSLTKHCSWANIQWEKGKMQAFGLDAMGTRLCSDSKITAGEPHHIVLTLEPSLTKPDGKSFDLYANGTDAAIISAKIVDIDGNLCPDANNNIKFEVIGEGCYKGSYNFYVTDNKPLTYHAPGDNELQAEGGQIRVAIRSTFKPGKVQVTAMSVGLKDAFLSYKTK
jgi:beta-galactosidase